MEELAAAYGIDTIETTARIINISTLLEKASRFSSCPVNGQVSRTRPGVKHTTMGNKSKNPFTQLFLFPSLLSEPVLSLSQENQDNFD